MYSEITLNKTDDSTVTLPFVANGTTTIRYKMLFNEELMPALSSIISSLYEDGGVTEEISSVLRVIGNSNFDCISKLAYVMNAQAEGNIKTASVDKYLDWLEQFDAMEFLFKSADIIGLYIGNKNGTSNPKKDTAPQTEK